MQDYVKREAALRYVENALESERLNCQIVANFLYHARNSKTPMVDVFVEMIRELSRREAKLVGMLIERERLNPTGSIVIAKPVESQPKEFEECPACAIRPAAAYLCGPCIKRKKEWLRDKENSSLRTRRTVHFFDRHSGKSKCSICEAGDRIVGDSAIGDVNCKQCNELLLDGAHFGMAEMIDMHAAKTGGQTFQETIDMRRKENEVMAELTKPCNDADAPQIVQKNTEPY